MSKLLLRRLKGKRPLERPERRCEDNIKIDITYNVWVGDRITWLR